MENIGVYVTAFGFIITCIIYFNSYDNRVKNSLPGLLITLCGIGILTETYAISILGVGYIIIYAILTSKKQKQANSKVIGGTMLDRFFVECVLAEVNDFSKEKNKQKAQLIAEKYRLKYPKGIEALYQQGLEAHKAVSQQFADNRLAIKRAEERQEFERLNRYSNLVGKDKRIAMLSDRAAELRKDAKDQDQFADLWVRSGQQKERDWAIWGGAASGLAGLGAGVSTAVDVQLKNMQIREENKKRLDATMPGYMMLTGSAKQNRANADAIVREIQQFKLKLISNDASADLMRKISFSNTDVLVSETGAAMVCTLASLSPNFRIFGDVPAIIDGTIIAKIYDGNELCGTAQLVLPVYGLGQNVPLNGICIDCCKPGKTYSVKFAAKNLWAMEA